MRRPIALLVHIFALTIIVTCPAQSLKPSDDGSSVQFKIKNFGSTTTGTMKGLDGSIDFDPTQIGHARFEVSVDASTVDTNVGLRDKHLKKEDYFDVVNYPRIKFVSTGVTSTEPGKYTMTGNLTIKATTKSISFPFTHTMAGGIALFEGEFPLNRRDFEVGGGSFSLSDNLVVVLKIASR